MRKIFIAEYVIYFSEVKNCLHFIAAIMKYMGDYVMIRGETPSDLVFFLLLVSLKKK